MTLYLRIYMDSSNIYDTTDITLKTTYITMFILYIFNKER